LYAWTPLFIYPCNLVVTCSLLHYKPQRWMQVNNMHACVCIRASKQFFLFCTCPPTIRVCCNQTHYVKTLNRSRNICNGSLTPVTCTHICNGCYLVPVTDKRGRLTPGQASATPVTNVDFW
jgi:hypothetical protein